MAVMATSPKGAPEFTKQRGREEESRGHYIRAQKGYFNRHMTAHDALQRKFQRLGHCKTDKSVPWDRQKPRDNQMYYIGEGGSNLKKMD
jgi:hypothetical protein